MYFLLQFLRIFGEENFSQNYKYEVRVTVVTVEDPGEMFHRVTFLPQLNIEC